jgi:hypothetical protein
VYLVGWSIRPVTDGNVRDLRRQKKAKEGRREEGSNSGQADLFDMMSDQKGKRCIQLAFAALHWLSCPVAQKLLRGVYLTITRRVN